MAKIEVIKQHDLKDCGACSLATIIKYYGGYVPIEKIREDTCTNNMGTSAYHLIKAATIYGFDAYGVKMEDKNIFDKNIFLPAIAHLILKNGLHHFVVIYKIAKNNIYIMDPAKGKLKLSIQEFMEIWDGILLLMSPRNDIACYEKEVSLFHLFAKLLQQNKKLFLKVLLVSILLMAFTILSNFYFQVSLSNIQAGKDANFIQYLIIIFGIVAVLKVITQFFKTYYENYFNKNVDVVLFSDFLTHIFNLPLKNIQNRSTGEIVTRVNELNDIKSLFSELFVNLLLDVILIVSVVVVLFFISDKLFLVLCIVLLLYIGLGILTSKIIYTKVKQNIDMTTDFNGVLVENVDMIYSIKNLNLVKEFNARLEDKLVLMLKNNFELTKLLNFIELFKNFVYEIGFFAVNTLGIYLIYQGEMEILSLVTFNSIILYLFDPIKNMINMIPKYNYLKASFSKLSEFIAIEQEKNGEGFNNVKNGAIKVKNLNYSYNQYTNILENLNLEVSAKSKVLLTGPSGSGKSTICKLLYRSLEKYSGMIYFDKMSELDYSLDAIRNNIVYVGQNEKLFTGTIRENIVCFRDVTDEEFQMVAKICNLEEIVAKRPFRYNTVINASLNNLSGGEKQRIILARALLKKATIIILDEALSEVNVDLEKNILKNIFDFYQDKTLLYVTHKNVDDLFKNIIRIGDSYEQTIS